MQQYVQFKKKKNGTFCWGIGVPTDLTMYTSPWRCHSQVQNPPSAGYYALSDHNYHSGKAWGTWQGLQSPQIPIQSSIHEMRQNCGGNRGPSPRHQKPKGSTVSVPALATKRHPQRSLVHVLTGQISFTRQLVLMFWLTHSSNCQELVHKQGTETWIIIIH